MKRIRQEGYLLGMAALLAAAYLGGAAIHAAIKHLRFSSVSGQAIASSACASWGLGFGVDGTAPTGNATCEELAAYRAAYRDPEEEMVIYLTFDAGYENGHMGEILDALKKHEAPATFFVVGTYIESNPDLVLRMVSEGHTVGNHTFHHPDMSAMETRENFLSELQSVEEQYETLTGQEMAPFYRPPQGKYSEENLKMACEEGYYTFFWSLAYVDWLQDDQPTREEAFSKLLSRIHPGAIVLLHSTSATNAEILDELLTRWEEMGYRYAPLSELAEKLKETGTSL